MKKFLKQLALVSLASIALWPTPSMAEEPANHPVAISGGLLCNTPEEVLSVIHGKREDGCGTLRGRLLAFVVFGEVYVYKGHAFQLAEYHFLMPTPWGNQVQYGFWGRPEEIGTAL